MDTRVVRRGSGIVTVAAGCLAFALCGCSGSTTQVAVPSVVNSYPVDATATLCAAGVHPRYVIAPNLSQADAGTNGYAVRSERPGQGVKVKAGSTVDLVLVTDFNGGDLSAHPRSTTVPNVDGVEVNKAVAEITRQGLLVNVATATPTGSLLVTGQAPAANTAVRGGSTVTLLVGQVGSQGCP
jgi:beta-lactam-binding protein with PASTA domain